jgi:uncharacterized membrane protein YGL010W
MCEIGQSVIDSPFGSYKLYFFTSKFVSIHCQAKHKSIVAATTVFDDPKMELANSKKTVKNAAFPGSVFRINFTFLHRSLCLFTVKQNTKA